MFHRIEPDLATAKALYPKVLTILKDFEVFIDSQNNISAEKFDAAYKKLEKQLHELTHKDMSRFMLWQWWEDNGIEALAFEIALPSPKPIMDMHKDELTEIIRRIKSIDELDEDNFDEIENNDKDKDDDFCHLINHFIGDYYHQLLQLSFPKSYDYGYFCSHVIDDNYVEFDIDDIVACIYSNQPFQTQYNKLFAKYSKQ